MTENLNKIIGKPIILSILLFLISSLFAGIFYVIHLIFPNIVYPHLFSFDVDSVCILALVYTFKFKEKLSFLNAFKVSFYFFILIFIRMIVSLIIHTFGKELSLFMISYIISEIVVACFTLPFTFIGLKLINMLGLKLLGKMNKVN